MAFRDPYDLLQDMTFVFGSMDEPDGAERFRAMKAKYMGTNHVPLDALRNAMLRMAGALAKANEAVMELAIEPGDEMLPSSFDPKLMSFEHEGGRIYNPTRSRNNLEPVDPEIYGFKPYHTGGGCMALRKDLEGGCYFLLTDSGGSSIPEPEEHDSILGLYTADFDCIATIEIGKIPPNPDSLLGFIESRKIFPVSVEEDLRDLVNLLVSEGRGYHLDDSPSEFEMFSPDEQKELSAFLKHTRAVLSEDYFWDIAFPVLNQAQSGMAP